MTVALYAEFSALPDQAGAIRLLLADFATSVRAEAGNLRFDAHQRADDDDAFFVYEEYAGDDAFAAHLAAPHSAVFNARLGELVVGGGSALTMLRPLGVPAA